MRKTHKATAKRFKITGKGKIVHNRQGDNAHLKTNKNRSQKARLNKQKVLASSKQAKNINILMN
ncbi:50S ribosomal protein L35 [Candidatus Dojkabacteria bacterium]|nr:50S ribosomal protein L35 [Candidatus Dojkabacteria bacterium]